MMIVRPLHRVLPFLARTHSSLRETFWRGHFGNDVIMILRNELNPRNRICYVQMTPSVVLPT